MKRIICVGNRYVLQDAAGPRVYDRLIQRPIPHNIEVIDGGLAGLDLLYMIEGTDRVVFVDGVADYAMPKEIVVLGANDTATDEGIRYDHAGGLAYLLGVLPNACEGEIPEVFVVGIGERFDCQTIATAAEICLAVASNGASGTFLKTLRERQGVGE